MTAGTGRWRRLFAVVTRGRLFLYLLLALVGVDATVHKHRRLWRAYNPNDVQERIQNCRRHSSDLLVVGGSPVSEGIDPTELTGITWQGQSLERVYSLGLPGATTSEVYHAVFHGVRTPPRVLVYGITASDLNDHRNEPNGPAVLMEWSDLPQWLRSRPEAAEWGIRQFLMERLARCWQLYYYRRGIRLWAADQAERVLPGSFAELAILAREGIRYQAAMHSSQGFAPWPRFQTQRLDHLKARGWSGDNFHFLDNYSLGGHLAYLHLLIDWAAHHGVTVVLVDMPVSSDLEDRLYPELFARYRAALAEVEQRRGVMVLRASRRLVHLDDADFADLIHLNSQGTARFSSWLRQKLAALTSAGAADRVALQAPVR
jgi:hypothetical protein